MTEPKKKHLLDTIVEPALNFLCLGGGIMFFVGMGMAIWIHNLGLKIMGTGFVIGNIVLYLRRK